MVRAIIPQIDNKGHTLTREEFDKFVDLLDDKLYSAGYTAKVADYNKLTIDVSKLGSEKNTPELSLGVKWYGRTEYGDEWGVIPTLHLTDLTFDPEDDYVDEFEYYLNRYSTIGRYLTELIKFTFRPEDWADDED